MRECRDYALLYNEVGIWGGMTDEERNDLRPIVVDMLENQARNAGIRLESRNINDFLPSQRTLHSNVLSLVDQSEFTAAMERAEELLMDLSDIAL